MLFKPLFDFFHMLPSHGDFAELLLLLLLAQSGPIHCKVLCYLPLRCSSSKRICSRHAMEIISMNFYGNTHSFCCCPKTTSTSLEWRKSGVHSYQIHVKVCPMSLLLRSASCLAASRRRRSLVVSPLECGGNNIITTR